MTKKRLFFFFLMALTGFLLFLCEAAFAYPSTDQVVRDVKAEYLKKVNERVEKVELTSSWRNEWSNELLKARGYPPDEASIAANVTHPKDKSGAVKVERVFVMYNQSGNRFSFSRIIVSTTETGGIPKPSREEMLKMALAAMKENPRPWFKDHLLSDVKRIEEIKIPDPDGYVLNTPDFMQFHVWYKYDASSGSELFTWERLTNGRFRRQGEKWIVLEAYRVDSKLLKREKLTKTQLDSMNNIEKDSFDGVYGATYSESTSKAFPPEEDILKAVEASLLQSEKDFQDLLGVSASSVIAAEKIEMNERSLAMNECKWGEEGSFSLPVKVRYRFIDPGPPYPMMYYVTQAYGMVLKPAGSGWVVVKSTPLGEKQLGVKSRLKGSPETLHDVFVKEGKSQ